MIARWQDKTDTIPTNYLIYLYGSENLRWQKAAEAICQALKVKLLNVNLQELLNYKWEQWPKLLTSIQREALLQNAVIYWSDCSWLLEHDYMVYKKLFYNHLRMHSWLHILAGKQRWQIVPELGAYNFIDSFIPSLSSQQALLLWQQALPNAVHSELHEIAKLFKLSPEQIAVAAKQARQLAFWENGTEAFPSKQQLYQACRAQTSLSLLRLAKEITPIYRQDMIILPADCQIQLDNLLRQIKYRHLVYDEWGFDKKLALGKGVIALFAGPPGTGKTMAAEVIAGSLGLTIYKIDLSMMVSKYIGETEKNLNHIFSEAENSQVILFFDEADALFGKRSEVKDAHDRYANIETSYLLQKMEEYPGIIILATNFKRNLDEAFIRRLHVSVEFAMPTADERLQIWQSIWPEHIRLAQNICLEKLATNIELTGGNIRNIALAAAFNAAADNNSHAQITWQHLFSACKQELKKVGRIISEDQLAQLIY